MCWNSRIPCSFTLNDLILFHDYIHSRSKVKNFIQHCCYIYSTFYAHPSLRIPRLQPALSFGNRRPTMVIWSAPLRRCLREEIWTFNGGAKVFWNEHGKNVFESTCMTPTVWPLFLFFSLHSFALTRISLRIFHFYKRSREALWTALWWLFLYQNCHLSISMFSNMVKWWLKLRNKTGNGEELSIRSVFKYKSYSRLPITRTLCNSNLPLTRSNFHFPSEHFLYNFTLDNSNLR